VKKYDHTKIIRRVPRSKITPAPDKNTTEEAIEIKSVHSTPNMNDVESIGRMNIEEFLEEQIPPIKKVQLSFNVTKNNKNLISFAGISILVVFFLVFSGIVSLFRFGWITANQIQFYVYVQQCCLPVILSTVYFIRKPNHLVVVLKDLNIL
jgi:hypothetical protein